MGIAIVCPFLHGAIDQPAEADQYNEWQILPDGIADLVLTVMRYRILRHQADGKRQDTNNKDALFHNLGWHKNKRFP